MKPQTNILQFTALWFTGIIAFMGMFTFCFCAIYKIYLDQPMMLVLSNVTVGSSSVFATLLTGRTISQLNQQSDVKNSPQTDNSTTPPNTNNLV